jgi:hypothetical protein
MRFADALASDERRIREPNLATGQLRQAASSPMDEKPSPRAEAGSKRPLPADPTIRRRGDEGLRRVASSDSIAVPRTAGTGASLPLQNHISNDYCLLKAVSEST